jgi:tol-pal system protein YbgF
MLLAEVAGLKLQLQTTGAASPALAGTSALERVDAMEAELRRLTSDTEEMGNRIDRVVADGTNRIGDLQFRLCEIEPGCDIGAIPDTPPLGGSAGNGAGAAVSVVPPPPPSTGAPDLAIGEQADFDRAKAAFDSSSFRDSATLFATFAETYTAGPLTGQAHYWRGRALDRTGDAEDAARAYLDSFSGAPDGERAPDALLRLGLALDGLGQRPDACAMLGEVTRRFPASDASIEAQTARVSLGCA